MAWIYRRGGKYWVGYRHNGKQVRRSTGTNDRQAAERELEAVKMMFSANAHGNLTEELFRLLTGKQRARVTLRAALRDWLLEAEGSASAATVDKYRLVARELEAFFNATDAKPLIADIDTEVLRGYLADIRQRVSPQTTNKRLAFLVTFFNREVRNGRIQSNPATAIKQLKERGEPNRRAFTMEEIGLMLRKAPDPFWRYMITGGYLTGLRLGDLACLTWGNVDLAENVIRHRAAKTGRLVTIPMARRFRELVDARRAEADDIAPDVHLWPKQAQAYLNGGSGMLSTQFSRLILSPSGLVSTRPKQRQGDGNTRQGSELSFHSLRHSFVSLLKLTGGSSVIAKELAGHSSDAVSRLYTHLPIEALAEAVNNLPEVQ